MKNFYRQFSCWSKGIETALVSGMPILHLAKKLSMRIKVLT